MELVYLWVEDYKNIKKQGFNFSPRFNCHYDEEKNELTIDENDDYIENFFGDNINVTAILGKNGSGKSSVLDELAFIVLSKPKNVYLIIKIENRLYCLSSKNDSERLVIDARLEVLQNYHINDILDLLFFESDDECPPVREDIINQLERPSKMYELTDIIYADKYFEELRTNNKILLSSSIIGTKLVKLIQKFGFLKNSFFDFDISEVYIDVNNEYFYDLKYNLSLIAENGKYYKAFDFIQNDIYNTFLLNLFFEIGVYEKFFDKCIIEIEGGYNINYEKAYRILDALEIELPIKYDEYNEFTKFLLSNELQPRLEDLPILKDIYFELFNFYVFDTLNRGFESLSHGEKHAISHLISIYEKISSSKKDNFLVLLDEIDISLHPMWQRKYLFQFISLLSKVNQKIHVVFSSHSPFLLSDIPKQNIIFLDKNEDGTCKVVDGLKEKKQTFGANIHTLLSDSFFMEDGLMGEFAKSKIDGVIQLLNKDKLSEDEIRHCEQIISIIGEPIVKNQLQRMLDSKRLKKVDEIDAIKKSMAEMQKRLDELEK